MRWTLPIDGSGSFLLPVVLLAAVPLLLWVQPPSWLIGAITIVAAGVLGGCGVVMAVAMARTMISGEAEHPEMVRFLQESGR